jgi:hypothetical protein
MGTAPRIGVEQAYQHVTSGNALLVCAYDDESKCNKIRLGGSIHLAELRTKLASLPKDQEIILYCA